MAAYSPKTGARCSCRPGVQRDNCPRCEGTGWVIDFKKIHERKNPMARRRQARVRYHSVRGGHYGEFGPRYLGYRMPITHRHYKRRTRSRRNPSFFPNPGRGGGSRLLLYGAIGIGAFFLLRGGALGNILGGAAAPPGYTQLGSSSYFRGPDGQLYTRSATGGMMLSPTQAPVGSAVEQQLIAAGSRLALPIVGSLATGISQMLGNLFTGGGATVNVPGGSNMPTGGGTASDILNPTPDGSLPPLPALPDLTVADWWSAPDSSSWFTGPSSNFTLSAPEPVSVMAMDLSLAPLPELPAYDFGSSFFGFGARARYAGYGQVRQGPSGELEARFLRQPPSSR